MKKQTSEDKKSSDLAEFSKQRNDKLKIYVFPKRRDVNMEQHFYFPKSCVELQSLAALAIYPVLCSKADYEKNNWFQLSRANMAIMAGISIKTVDKGISDLMNHSNVLKIKKASNGKEHYNMYKVNFVRRDMIKDNKDNIFIFNTCIIHSGKWAKLSLRAKSIYIAFRFLAKFDAELHDYEYETSFHKATRGYADTEEGLFTTDYRNRMCDYYTEPISNLFRAIGIRTSNMNPVLQELIDNKLLSNEGHSLFKVYLKPQIKYK